MGYLRFMSDSSDEVLSGEYFSMMPKLPTIAGVKFHYDIMNDNDSSYSKLLDTITAPLKTMTLKTNDNCGFKVNGYVKGQDGGLWQVTGVIETLVNSNNKQALRRRKTTIQTVYIVRLIGVENPWDI
jgi:hypothetical protein